MFWRIFFGKLTVLPNILRIQKLPFFILYAIEIYQDQQSPLNPAQPLLNSVQSPLNPADENMSTPTSIADPNIS